jgi:hypothetical protein
MIYGYARVSTDAQDFTSQLAQLKAAGCEKIFREKITGTTADRPQLKKLMRDLAQGDVVITPAVDRLSRDVTDLLGQKVQPNRSMRISPGRFRAFCNSMLSERAPCAVPQAALHRRSTPLICPDVKPPRPADHFK